MAHIALCMARYSTGKPHPEDAATCLRPADHPPIGMDGIGHRPTRTLPHGFVRGPRGLCRFGAGTDRECAMPPGGPIHSGQGGGRTLKLDLTDYQRSVLIAHLRSGVEEAEREGSARAPYPTALAEVLGMVTGHAEAVALAKQANETGGREGHGPQRPGDRPRIVMAYEGDETTVVIGPDGAELGQATYTELGWGGMAEVRHMIKRVAEALGAEVVEEG